MELKSSVRTLEHVPLSKLTPFQENMKMLSDGNYRKLRREIEETGFSFAVHVWENMGHLFILDGHQRVECLRRMYENMPDPLVPIVKVAAVDFKEAKRKVMAAASQYGEFNTDNLRKMIETSGLTISQCADHFHFPEIDLKALIPDVIPPYGEEAPLSEPKVVKTVKGDVYELGGHRLVCGDATVLEDAEKLMRGEKADMVWTDPPYNVAYEGKTKDALTIENDSMEGKAFYQFLYDAFVNMLTATKPGGAIYVAHADSEGANFRSAMVGGGWLLKQCLIWVKQHMVMGRQDYHWQHEPILYGWAPGAAHNWYSDRKQTTVLNFDRPHRNEEHPTMKPVDLIEYMLGNSSARGDIVLDPFGGSGSTLVACQKQGRKARLLELDPKYCDVIVTRYCKLVESAEIIRNGEKVIWSF